MFKQILCDRLGIDPHELKFIDGDTDRVAFGMGSNGSRSMVVGGGALTLAAQKVIDKGKNSLRTFWKRQRRTSSLPMVNSLSREPIVA